MTPRPTPRRACSALLLATLLVVGPSAVAEAAVDTDPVGVWPLSPEPEVVTGFDPPEDPWGAGHRGVDLLGAAGQPVRSALPGRVSWAGVLAGRGVVVVDHGTTRTTYEPVDATVDVGDEVAGGERIGRLALPGSHCLPHACLHWGWIEGETYLDPLRLVGGGPVRLLPLWQDAPPDPAAPPTVARVSPYAAPYAGWRPPLALGLDTPVALTPVDVLAGRPAAAGPW